MKEKRLEEMEAFIGERNTVKMNELAEHFGMSMSTLRRDLDKLASENKIVKSYGSVSLTRPSVSFLHSQNTIHMQEKKKIASFAARLIDNGDIIFIDSGSTCGLITDFIPDDFHVTIITNNLDVIIRGMRKETLDIYSIPGKLNRKNNSFSYMQDCNPYKDYNIGKIFVSCAGIDIEYGISHNEVSERTIKKYAIERTTNRILLADSTKFGHIAPLHVCEIKAFSILCTNEQPPEAYIDYCLQNRVQLIYE